MPRRRGSRRIALDVLYAHEVSGNPTEEILTRYESDPAAEHAAMLVRGVQEHVSELDRLIGDLSEDWDIERMPLIDLTLMRLGAFEILHVPDVPTAVTIDELVELAKTYSTEDSGRFINGVLARIADQGGAIPLHPPL